MLDLAIILRRTVPPATSVGREAYAGGITLFATDMPLNKSKKLSEQ
jgi:hypothetical protein